jgi:hypothetical protein
MNVKLTKDSDALICLLYKQYCQQRKKKVSKADARFFGSSEDIQKSIAPKWTLEDVDETCRELHRADILVCEYADDVVYESWLSDIGIIYMESRFADGLDSVLSYLEKIRNFLPF